MECPSQQNGNQLIERLFSQPRFQFAGLLGCDSNSGPLGLLNEAIPITPLAKDAQAASL